VFTVIPGRGRRVEAISGFLTLYRRGRRLLSVGEVRGRGLSLAAVRDLRDVRVPVGPEELATYETDVLASFVLARAAAGLSDGTISSDVVFPPAARAGST